MKILIGIGCIVGIVIIIGAVSIYLVAAAKHLVDELNSEIDKL